MVSDLPAAYTVRTARSDLN